MYSDETHGSVAGAHSPLAALGVSIAVMGLIASVAVSIPAFRASRVDPFTALRAD